MKKLNETRISIKLVTQECCIEHPDITEVVNHHIIPSILGGTKTVPLCNECHRKVHDLKHNKASISQLTKEGIKKAIEKGSKLGAPTTIGREKKREVYMAKQHNLSFREIARRTGLSYSSVRRILSNPNLEQEVL